jgi:hypothetical protein
MNRTPKMRRVVALTVAGVVAAALTGLVASPAQAQDDMCPAYWKIADDTWNAYDRELSDPWRTDIMLAANLRYQAIAWTRVAIEAECY